MAFEVTASHVDKGARGLPPAPDAEKNAERFITPELKAFEDKALSAQERGLAREMAVRAGARPAPAPCGAAHAPGSRRWRSWTCSAALAERSLTLNWCAPQFVNEPCIDIEAGRHPVVEGRLAETSSGAFIPNHTRLNAGQRMQIITGPNMGGKSTYMRQVASSCCWPAWAAMCRPAPAAWGR